MKGNEWVTTDVPPEVRTIPDVDAGELKKQILQHQILRFSQDTKHRNTLVYWVMSVTCVWIVAVLVVVFLVGYRRMELSSSVLVTLLATTTANVLGLPLVVLRGLFKE